MIISIIAAILSLTGNLMVNKKNKIGFIVWILSNVLWVYVAITSKNYPQAIMFFLYSGLNIQGYMEWRIRPPK